MTNFSPSSSADKQVIIHLRDFSHEACVAVTQTTYWQQLTQNSSISITADGKYVPIELSTFCTEEAEPRLHLTIRSQHEHDIKKLKTICARINCDLDSFKNHDRPTYDTNNDQMIVFGSLFNSLPTNVFETERNLLGQRNCNIKKIRNTLGCSIVVDDSTPQRYRFTIHHENGIVMHLAAIQIRSLVKQAQEQYVIAFATKLGRSLVGPIERMETSTSSSDPYSFSSSSNPYSFPSFTPFQPIRKRRREDDEEQPTISAQAVIDSDQSDDDETTSDEIRQQHRAEIELLLNGICKRMQDRTPKDEVAKAREDSSQIKAYFRNTNALKTINNDSELSIELVEHEIDLRTRGITDHKCTLVFNKQLKMGAGVCDRLKRTAKVRAYKQLITMTRDTPREDLIIRQTRDKLWKAIIKPTNN